MLPLFFFGKHPAENDFLCTPRDKPAVSELDRWLLDAMEWANAHSDAKWLDALSSGSAKAFVFRSPLKKKQLVVGALRPSRDGAGRQFPLVAATEAGADQAGVPVGALPIALEPVWQQAEAALAQASSTSTMTAPGSAELHPASVASDAYQNWIQSQQMPELRNALFTGDAAEARFEQAYAMLQECLVPYRGVEWPTTPLGLRLPLGSFGGAAVCFWLDLTRRITGWKKTIPSFFWSDDDAGGSMLMYLGSLPKHALRELWLPSDSNSEVCDLTSQATLNLGAPKPPLPQPDSASTVQQFLDSVR